MAQGVDRHWLENVAGGVRDTWEQFDDDNGALLAAAIRAAGYDGVLTNELCPETDEAKLAWIAFEPTQIKSVLNPGTWDPRNPRLRDAEAMASLPRGHALQLAGPGFASDASPSLR